MNASFCVYHPDKPSHTQCANCGNIVCDDRVDLYNYCPLCYYNRWIVIFENKLSFNLVQHYKSSVLSFISLIMLAIIGIVLFSRFKNASSAIEYSLLQIGTIFTFSGLFFAVFPLMLFVTRWKQRKNLPARLKSQKKKKQLFLAEIDPINVEQLNLNK